MDGCTRDLTNHKNPVRCYQWAVGTNTPQLMKLRMQYGNETDSSTCIINEHHFQVLLHERVFCPQACKSQCIPTDLSN